MIKSDDTAEQIANLALFSNMQSLFYWSGMEYAPFPITAWLFGTGDGRQFPAAKSSGVYAVAVRPSDVISEVPEPQTLALMLLALGATALVRRKRAR